jgi:hypothetical protein
MALLNGAVFIATSGGTGSFVVSGNAQGYQTPAAAGSTDGLTYHYRAQSADLTQWEEGSTVSASSGTSFSRTVTASSAGGTAKVSFTNPPTVALVAVVTDFISFDTTMSLTTMQRETARSNINADFLSGTVMTFQQGAAPLNWTKVTTYNDAALRVVSGTPGSGGSNGFSTVMAQTVVGSTTLTASQIPSHTHQFTAGFNLGDGTSGFSASAISGNTSSGGISSNQAIPTQTTDGGTGGNGSHNHPITMSMLYVDVIIASKD